MISRLSRSAAVLAVALAGLALGATQAASADRSIADLTVGRTTAPTSSAAVNATTTWCGTTSSTEDRKPDLEESSDKQIHVIYAIPADGADRFAEIAPKIVSDVAVIDAWWQAQDPTRRPRWDLYAFPGCTSRIGMLDLRLVRLPRGASAYVDSWDIDSLIGDLVGTVGMVEKDLVYYDGPRSETQICGTSTMAALYAGRFAFSFIWLGGACNGDLGAGASAAATAAHELTHDLGAVALVGPPHGCSADGILGHVCDSTNDLMFPYSSGTPLGALVLDVGHDDYYGHTGTWWDVQDSSWLSHLPQRRVTVNVQTQSGQGTVVTDPMGKACAGTCESTWDDALPAKLIARPADGARLWSWSGGCSGWGSCSPPASGDVTVTATFGPMRYRLTVSTSGKGRVVSNPTAIDCGRGCGGWFAPGTPVTLRARPTKGWRLAGWSGACRGSGACHLSMSRDSTARARFVRTAR